MSPLTHVTHAGLVQPEEEEAQVVQKEGGKFLAITGGKLVRMTWVGKLVRRQFLR